MSQRALQTMHKERMKLRVSRFGRSVITLVASLMLLLALVLLMADKLFRPNSFVIKQVTVHGDLMHVDKNAIESLVKKQIDGNFFSVNLIHIKQQIEAQPWVRYGNIKREWPNGLAIYIDEHKPVVRWNESQWLNSYGQVINEKEAGDFKNAIHLFGDKKNSKQMLQRVFVWKKQLIDSGLVLRKLSLSSSYSWHLTLQDEFQRQFELVLGSHNEQQRLMQFLSVYRSKFRRDNLILQRVDARYPDGLAVKSKQLKTS